jgi:hypothetical protein
MIGFLLGHLGRFPPCSLLVGGSAAMFFPGAALAILKALGALPKPLFIAACGLLAFLFIRAEGESRHWHKQSDRYEKLYGQEHSGRIADRKSYTDAQAEGRRSEQGASRAHQTAIAKEITDATVSRLNDLELIRGELRRQGSTAQGAPGSSPQQATRGSAPPPELMQMDCHFLPTSICKPRKSN